MNESSLRSANGQRWTARLRKIFRPRNWFLVLLVLVVGWHVRFAYRTNYVCGPDEHIIQSDADAIKQAQKLMFKAHYASHGISGYIDEKPYIADFSQADCCTVRRVLSANGVIVWKVSLDGETIGEPRPRHVSADILLSNCGAVFDDDSYIVAEPIR
ncbi:hypothetical protein [Bradyrhizobium sp. NP1]|uniref:hypothetical protein n=1 Tax=Bradyrhizobium sp. NP1 TaxID=3049772 RepID=UPI0025A60551|nr:hypothetical protein [Bradyrhizobium sp. NP1]WJR76456.1 hypothetical protein QOU61_27385 [Bradyrhizobium sp. NP1]